MLLQYKYWTRWCFSFWVGYSYHFVESKNAKNRPSPCSAYPFLRWDWPHPCIQPTAQKTHNFCYFFGFATEWKWAFLFSKCTVSSILWNMSRAGCWLTQLHLGKLTEAFSRTPVFSRIRLSTSFLCTNRSWDVNARRQYLCELALARCSPGFSLIVSTFWGISSHPQSYSVLCVVFYACICQSLLVALLQAWILPSWACIMFASAPLRGGIGTQFHKLCWRESEVLEALCFAFHLWNERKIINCFSHVGRSSWPSHTMPLFVALAIYIYMVIF